MIDHDTRPAPSTLSWLPSVAALALGIALLAASAIPFERVQAAVDAFSADGHAESFTRALHHAAVVNLRVVAAALIAFAAWAARCREQVARRARSLWIDTRTYVSERRPIERASLVLLAAITAAGAAVRALALRQPVNYDEAFTYITYVRRPLWVSLSDYSYPNNHVLHTLLAHLSTRVFGMGPVALRLPAFIAGVAIVPLTYLVARKLSDDASAIVAAALVAASEVLIAFSVLARGYSLLTAAFLLALLFAADIARGDRRAWAPFVIACSLGFYALPTFIYPFGVLGMWIAWTAPRTLGALTAAALATLAIVIVLYLPILVVSGLGAGAAYGYGSAAPSSVARFARDCWTDWVRGANPFVAAAMGAAAIGAAIGGRPLRRLGAATLACAIAAVVLQRVAMPPRVWLFTVPIALMLAANAIGSVARDRPAIVAVVCALVCLDAFRLRPPQYVEEYGSDEIAMVRDVEAATTFVGTRLTPRDAIAAAFPTIDLVEYYLRLHGMPVEPLRNPPPSAVRYLVVTNDRVGNSLAAVIDARRLDVDVSRRQLLLETEFNRVYSLPKRPQ